MYWIWANERSNDTEARLGGVPATIEQANLEFDNGSPIGRPVPAIDLIRDDDGAGRLTDNLIAPGARGLVLSSKLRQVLKNAGVDNIEYFPCRIVGSDGKALSDYEIGNVLGRIACVDIAASDVEMDPDYPDRIQYINALVLNESAIGDALIFRLQEHSQVIVVEARIKTACETAGITGVRFYEPAAFSM